MQLYHVTVLSNFARGYDRYRRIYSKAGIPESTYPDRFFLLDAGSLASGIDKAKRLLEKLGFSGDRLILLSTEVDPGEIRRDHATGIGVYVPRNEIDVVAVAWLDPTCKKPIEPAQIEDVMAASLQVIGLDLVPWAECRPRTISILPIGQACQASCRFCFSKVSVSDTFRGRIRDFARIGRVLDLAKLHGAERAVITGGGEPMLLKATDLLDTIEMCRSRFEKVVMITNAGCLVGNEDPGTYLGAMRDAGLSVLAISRHHHERARAEKIMGIDVDLDRLGRLASEMDLGEMRLRLICVLQKEGVASAAEIEDYLAWAAGLGITEVNFKELYVSTGLESAYADLEANAYSASMQVPLRVVFDFVAKHGWAKVGELPWGAPIFAGTIGGVDMQIAAYTEPSVFWERTHGTVRSWNLMSDGRVLASLEDIESEVCL